MKNIALGLSVILVAVLIPAGMIAAPSPETGSRSMEVFQSKDSIPRNEGASRTHGEGMLIPEKYILDKDKPVLVMFTASWCQPCRIMKQNVFKEEDVAHRLDCLNLLYFDIDSNEGKLFSERFKPAGYEGIIPFFALISIGGEIIGTNTGAVKAEEFSVFLDKALKTEKHDGKPQDNTIFRNAPDIPIANEALGSNGEGHSENEHERQGIATEKQGQELKMLCIGSKEYPQFIMFLDDADKLPSLKAVAKKYDLTVVDKDNPQRAYEPYMYLAGPYPTFIFTDGQGTVKAGMRGYVDADSFIQQLAFLYSDFRLDIPYAQAVKNNKKHLKMEKRRERYDRLVMSGWRIDAGVNVWLTFLSGNNSMKSEPRAGYGIYAAGRKYLNKAGTAAVSIGLSIDSWGAQKRGNGEYPEYFREYMLRVPVEAELDIFRFALGYFAIDVKGRIGIWGGWIPFHTTVSEDYVNGDFKNADAGVSAAIALQAGSFDLTFGYSRGFINQLCGTDGATAYNNAFMIGVSVNIGD